MSRKQNRSSAEGAVDPALVQKKRARHRLVGALSVCLIAALVVPLVLESEPKQPRDVPMEIAASARTPAAAAGKGATTPGSVDDSGSLSASGAGDTGSQGAAPSQSAIRTITPPEAPSHDVTSAAVAPLARAPSPPPVPSRPEAKPDSKQEAKHEAKLESKHDAATGSRSTAAAAQAPETRPQPKAEPKVAAKVEPKAVPGVEARAETGPAPARSKDRDGLASLIDRATHGGSAKSAPATQRAEATVGVSRRFLVQIGAFSNVQSARNVSDVAVQAGLRPYQETVKTAQGDWIRVRLGPFATRQDAEKAQQDLKRAGVTAAIIAL